VHWIQINFTNIWWCPNLDEIFKYISHFFIFVPRIFIKLIFFHQQMYFYLTYKILNNKIYIKTLFFTFTSTCFGPYGPSSGSLY